MQRVSTTVVALAGERARPCLRALERAANVRTVLVAPEEPTLDRAAAAWRAAQGTNLPYQRPLVAGAGPPARRGGAGRPRPGLRPIGRSGPPDGRERITLHPLTAAISPRRNPDGAEA